MNDFSQYAEYSVKKEKSKYSSLFMILLIIFSTIISALFTVIMTAMYGIVPAFLFGAVILCVSLIIIMRMFRTIHYDYRITNGELYFSEVINNRRRKELCNLIISHLDMIAPYSGKYKDSADRINYNYVFDYSSGVTGRAVYYAVDTDSEDSSVKILYLFEPSEKMLKLFKYYNRNTVIQKTIQE